MKFIQSILNFLRNLFKFFKKSPKVKLDEEYIPFVQYEEEEFIPIPASPLNSCVSDGDLSRFD
jgi:hypothetical protein